MRFHGACQRFRARKVVLARGFAEVGQHHAFKAGGQGVVAVVGGLVGEQHHLVAHGRPQVRKLGGDHFGSAGVQAVMVQPDALAC